MDKLPLLGTGLIERDADVIIGVSSLRVPFHDCDPAGVVWHGNYFKYFDAARCLILDAIGYGYPEMVESGYLWPVVDTRVKYVGAIGYDDTIVVRASLVEWEYRLKFEYAILDSAGTKTTSGYSIQVAVSTKTRELCPFVPEFVKDRIKCLPQTS